MSHMFDTNLSEVSLNGPGGFGNKPIMSKADVLKVIKFLTKMVGLTQGDTDGISHYDEDDPFERQLDFIVEEAKR